MAKVEVDCLRCRCPHTTSLADRLRSSLQLKSVSNVELPNNCDKELKTGWCCISYVTDPSGGALPGTCIIPMEK